MSGKPVQASARRFAHILGDEGKEMVMHGEYREVDPVTRVSDATVSYGAEKGAKGAWGRLAAPLRRA